jgi:hypothetical protein
VHYALNGVDKIGTVLAYRDIGVSTIPIPRALILVMRDMGYWLLVLETDHYFIDMRSDLRLPN